MGHNPNETKNINEIVNISDIVLIEQHCKEVSKESVLDVYDKIIKTMWKVAFLLQKNNT